MYNISNAYRAKMLDKVQTHKLSGSVSGTFAFTDEDVIGVSYANQCADKNVTVGSVNIGTLKLTFLRDILNRRGDYYGKTITISDGLLLSDHYEYVPLGTFYIAEAMWTGAGMIAITAYDCLSLMDKPLTFNQSAGTLYDWCQIISAETGAPFGMTQAECEALPNGDVLLSPWPESDMTTFRDLLSKLAQTVGGFACADRQGRFVIKTFSNTPVITIPNIRRFSGASYSDFTTRFDGISFIDTRNGGDVVVYGDEEGYLMELGDAPFLQYGTHTQREERATAIFNQISLMTYTPYTVSLLPAFIALDLGDVISFSDDYAQETSSGALMSMSFQYNKSIKIACYGANPNLKSAKSKTDNAISGVRSSTNETKLLTYVTTNAQRLGLNALEHEVTSTDFTTSTTTQVLSLTEMKMTLNQATTVQVFYYVNSNLQSYSPVETYSAGTHTMSLMYPLQGLNPNARQNFTVKVKLGSGTGTIEAMDARTYVQATGANQSGKWDGYIGLKDDWTIFSYDYDLAQFTDTCELVTDGKNITTVTENIAAFTYNIGIVPLSDAEEFSLVAQKEVYSIVTEDEDNLATEDGDQFIT